MLLKYDLHTHILPATDDGAQTVEESLTILEALKDKGVENICFTPHFYTHKESIEDFLARREAGYNELLSSIPSGINVKLGAEVYVTKYLFSEERDLKPLCISGTDYMLTEFPYTSEFSSDTMRMLTRIMDFAIIPILPHVERYPHLLKNPDKLRELVDMGVVIQSNYISYTEGSVKRKLLKLLSKGYIHVLSSDVHNLNRNSPDSSEQGLDFIKKKCSVEIINYLQDNAENVFNGRFI